MSTAKNNKQRMVQSSEEESDSSSPPIKYKLTKQQEIHNKKIVKNKHRASFEEEDNVIVENKTKTLRKTQNKIIPQITNALRRVKKEESSQQPSDSSEEKPQKKVIKTKSPLQVALNKKKPVKKQTSSEEQSEQQLPKKIVKPKTAKLAVKLMKAKKESSEEEEYLGEEEPKKSKKVQQIAKVKSPVHKDLNKKKQPSEQEQEVDIQPQKVKKQPEVIIPKKHKVEQKAEQQIDEEGQFEVCVKGLSFYTNQSDIEQIFNSVGNLINAKLLTREDGKSKGIAFVKFSSKKSYSKALELNGTQHLGRNITVEPSHFRHCQNNPTKKNHQQSIPVEIISPTLFVGGLSFNTTKEAISSLFSSAGEVVSVRIVTDKQTGKSKGFGYVQFNDVDAAKKAYQTFNNTQLDGRQLRIDNATQKDKLREAKRNQIRQKVHQSNIVNKGSLATFRGSLMAL